MAAVSAFSAASIHAVTNTESSTSSIVRQADDKLKASSYYLDSTGRSSISLPLRLDFADATALKTFLESTQVQRDEKDDTKKHRYTLAVEAKVTLTFGSGEAISAAVEDVSILATTVEESSIRFDTAIVVKVSRKGPHQVDSASVKTVLEVTAALTEKMEEEHADTVSLLESLNIGFQKKEAVDRLHQTRLPPITLSVSMTNALAILVRSLSESGDRTLISVTIRHANTHSDPVTITGVSCHPNQSLSLDNEPVELRNVARWGYVLEPKWPVTLAPHQAVATILQIDATDDERARDLLAPVSVTATVGSSSRSGEKFYINALAQAQWHTRRAAIEPSEAFRIEITLPDPKCVVGSVFTLEASIENLHAERCENMGLEIADDENHTPVPIKSNLDASEHHRFRVHTISDAEERDGELIAVDTTIALGELPAHKATMAKLRFIPLRAGTLRIPNFSLVNTKSGSRYLCKHSFQVVVQE